MRGVKAKRIRYQRTLWAAPDPLPQKVRRYHPFIYERIWKVAVRDGRIRLVKGWPGASPHPELNRGGLKARGRTAGPSEKAIRRARQRERPAAGAEFGVHPSLVHKLARTGAP